MWNIHVAGQIFISVVLHSFSYILPLLLEAVKYVGTLFVSTAFVIIIAIVSNNVGNNKFTRIWFRLCSI